MTVSWHPSLPLEFGFLPEALLSRLPPPSIQGYSSLLVPLLQSSNPRGLTLSVLDIFSGLLTQGSDLFFLVLTLSTISSGFPAPISSLPQGCNHFLVYFKAPTISANLSQSLSEEL